MIMQDKLPLKINHLQHAGIPVTDIKVSEHFYSRLGFHNVMQRGFSMDGNTGTCIMMQNGTVIIELYQLPDTFLAEIKSRNHGHIDHIAFDVDDIDATFTLMKEQGYQILEEAPVSLSFWKSGCKYFNILGPDGERLEFNQVL